MVLKRLFISQKNVHGVFICRLRFRLTGVFEGSGVYILQTHSSEGLAKFLLDLNDCSSKS